VDSEGEDTRNPLFAIIGVFLLEVFNGGESFVFVGLTYINEIRKPVSVDSSIERGRANRNLRLKFLLQVRVRRRVENETAGGS